VETDLESLHRILRLINHFAHLDAFIDLNMLDNDFAGTFTSELDYVTEGKNAEQFQRNLLMNMHVDVPQIFWDLSTKRVLTMEFMDGVRVDDLAAIDAAGIDRKELAANLGDLFFGMVLEDGLYHADPHPGNVFVRSDGVIQLIDFGMVGTITPEMRRYYGDLVLGMVRHDAPRIVQALKDLGFVGPGADTTGWVNIVEPYIDALIQDTASFYTGASMVEGAMHGRINLTVDPATMARIQQFIFSQPITLPGQTTFLFKSVITVVGLCLRLDPDLDLIGAARAHMGAASTMQTMYEMAARMAGEGWDAVKSVIPTARAVASFARKLDDGTFNAVLGRSIEYRVKEAQRQQTKQIVRAIAVATGVIAATIWRRGR